MSLRNTANKGMEKLGASTHDLVGLFWVAPIHLGGILGTYLNWRIFLKKRGNTSGIMWGLKGGNWVGKGGVANGLEPKEGVGKPLVFGSPQRGKKRG